MLIDLSRYKLFVLLAIVSALVGFVLMFTFFDSTLSIVDRAREVAAASRSNLFYYLRYKLPAGSGINATGPSSGTAISIPVLLYHGEGASSDMPIATFVEQMSALKAAGWHTITMQQFDQWQRGTLQLPDKSFLLTFDDGRKDTYYQADPVLRDMGFNGVMFVITGLSLPDRGKQSSFYLNKTELADMVASGRWELESHGKNDHALYAVQSTTDSTREASTTNGHFLTNKFWSTDAARFETDGEFEARVTDDLKASKAALEQTFHVHVIAFAYPFNDFGEDSVNFPGSQSVLDAVVPHSYTYAFYQTWKGNDDSFNYPGANNGPGTSAYMIKRIEPLASWSGNDLISKLDQGHAKSLPYTSSALGPEWEGRWGDTAYTSRGLQLSASKTTSGASTFLNGAGWWSDYLFSASVDLQQGSSISLLARADSEAYVACAYSGTRVTLLQHAGNTQTTIAALNYALADVHHARVGIAVVGDRATCYADDGAIVSGTLNAVPARGDVGLEVWDKTLGLARSVISDVSIRSADHVDVPR